MFLKGFKKKSAKKYIDKILQQPRNLNNNIIKTIGILVDATVYESFPYINEIVSVFKTNNENITILYYYPDKKQAQLAINKKVFTKSDLGFNGKINVSIVKQFTNTKFDCLLNFYTEDKLLLNLASVQSEAEFKIGFTSINPKINDFSIATNINNITEFTFELKKYLTLLNKI